MRTAWVRRIAAVAGGVALAAAWAVPFAAAQDEESRPQEPTGPVTRVVHVVHLEDGTPFPGADVEAYGLPGGVVTKTAGDDATVRFVGVPRRGVTFVARHAGRRCGWREPGAGGGTCRRRTRTRTATA